MKKDEAALITFSFGLSAEWSKHKKELTSPSSLPHIHTC